FERIRADAAAGILGVEVRTVQALAARGEVPGAAKIGGLWTFEESALRSFRLELDETKTQAKSKAQPVPPEDTVYVIRCDYKVKIGYTRNLAQRLHSLRTSNPRPIDLLVSFPGTRADEKRLHQKFSDLRFSGEWFRLRKPIKEWLREEHGVFQI
ncbi:GIY-YIG nuclease family protein, partial [Parvibaculum sp.]|uniref:GIY-YIG nuclease family protein n=1 Tax=Parvibaculum sp. TaxID=2024848 RepID=UPI0032118756